MICPKCVEENKKSTIMVGGGYSTLMGWQPYYDEDGKYHSHNPNQMSSQGICSNGHKLTIISGSSCANCDFGSETSITASEATPVSLPDQTTPDPTPVVPTEPTEVSDSAPITLTGSTES